MVVVTDSFDEIVMANTAALSLFNFSVDVIDLYRASKNNINSGVDAIVRDVTQEREVAEK